MSVNSFDNYPLAWKPEKEKLKQPYFKALAEDLENRIKRGILKPGTKLPPQREIADYLNLNYTTITRVYEICKKKGLVYGAAGKGTFVSPHSSENITITASNLTDGCIEMGAVNGFSEYTELTERATRAVVEKGYLRNLYEYTHPAGQPHQLAAGIRWMEQLGVHTDNEHTAIFAGAQNAITVALVSLFSPGDKIATDQYTYSNLIELAKLLHIVLVPIRGDKNGMCPDDLKRQCGTNKMKGIYLMPSCANPTTIVISKERREELAAVIRKHRLILIEDDVSAWMPTSIGNMLPSMFDLLAGQSIYICGMTKNLCPGLRIAYMTFAECFRQEILHGLFNINVKTSSLDAEIITELILNGDAYKIAEHKHSLTERACALFAKYFPECWKEHGKISYYQWMPIEIEKPFRDIEEDFISQGIRVYHSERFAVAKNQGHNFLRVTLCSAGSMRKLEKGLQILKSCLD
ncbi:HTH-type transcriptional regulator NorG [Oxobacter pfennigii]|uniref:HTH-type transcriptional regulator NorG n=1 Tax=Oxobacter pfennigii TaxID=36849 RepID=A0A0P8WY10_9CLOT|nr:PLP-dependent aminotransferase family protein [Oxobacter pfennigii]KPU43250.1 HTH-type transcriptional regulator NorG [Oxobacter pfennigii]